jgi:hypothetical protein
MHIEIKSYTCFGQSKLRSVDSSIWTIASNNLPSMVSNKNSSFVVIEAWKNLIFQPLIFNNKHHNEHHRLERQWYLLHINFHILSKMEAYQSSIWKTLYLPFKKNVYIFKKIKHQLRKKWRVKNTWWNLPCAPFLPTFGQKKTWWTLGFFSNIWIRTWGPPNCFKLSGRWAIYGPWGKKVKVELITWWPFDWLHQVLKKKVIRLYYNSLANKLYYNLGGANTTWWPLSCIRTWGTLIHFNNYWVIYGP